MLLQLLRPLLQGFESLTKTVHAVHVIPLLWLVLDGSPPRVHLRRKKRTKPSTLCRRRPTCAVSAYVESAARSGIGSVAYERLEQYVKADGSVDVRSPCVNKNRNCYLRFQLMERTAREGMTNVLAPEAVPFRGT